MSLKPVLIASLAFLLLSLSTSWAANKDNRRHLELSTDQQQLLDASLNANSIVVVGRDNELGENLYRATKEYYSQFSYLWHPKRLVTAKDVEGVDGVQKSNITDRATQQYQIYSLLREIYTNPLIPGYRRDVSFKEEYRNDVGKYVLKDGGAISTAPQHIYATATFGDVTYIVMDDDNTPLPYDGKGDWGAYSTGLTYANRADFEYVDYPAHDFFPFDTGEVSVPINGATALVVELSDDFHDNPYENGVFKTSNFCANFEDFYKNLADKYDNDPRKARVAFMDEIFRYVKAVTLMPNQLYVNKDVSPDNPGFIFNLDASISKCFVITKGCNRAIKRYTRKMTVETKSEGEESKLELQDVPFFSGEPFYQMFEEYSPSNGGPLMGAFQEMNSGQGFYVDHSCGTSLQQQHDIVFPNKLDDNTSFNVNLMMFLPDRRFDYAKTSMHPSDFLDSSIKDNLDDYVVSGGTRYVLAENFKASKATYTPYAFYSPDHRPYIYFNKILADIEVPYFKDGALTDENNTTIKASAWVPVNWLSQYNQIVGHEAQEEFLIYRVTNGNIEKNPIPASQILIDFERTDDGMPDGRHTELNPETGAIITWSDRIFVKVLEDLIDADKNVDRTGNEVSYIIKGKRSGNNDFVDVQSNVVTGYLPGNDITIRLNRAKSTGLYTDHQNHYENTIDIVYNGFKKEIDGSIPFFSLGNILFSDLISTPAKNVKPKEQTREQIKSGEIKLKNIELRIYRHAPENDDSPNLEESVYVGKLKFSENTDYPGLGVSEWYNDDKTVVNGSAIVVYLEAFDADGNKFDVEVKDEKGNVTGHRPAYRAKLNTVGLEDSQPWLPFDADNDVFASFTDIFLSKEGVENIFSRFRYYMVLADAETAENNEASAYSKKSNYANVFVPKRDVMAGFIPYTEDEIKADINGDLPLNQYGMAINVLNNSSVSGYEIYHHTLGKVARIDRYTNGSFESAVYDLNTSPEDRDRYNATVQKKYPDNYSGPVVIRLPEEAIVADDHDEQPHFSAEIQYYNDGGTYSGNTYIMPTAYLPSRPTLALTGIEDVSGISPKDDKYQYDVTLLTKVTSTIPLEFDKYDRNNYGIWYTEVGDHVIESEKQLIRHPGKNYVDFPYPLTNGVLGDQSSDSFEYPHRIENVVFTHTYQATTTSFVMFNKNARVYAQLPAESEYKISDEPNTPGYLVADASRLFGLYSTGQLSGIDDIVVSPDIDNNAEEMFFNLQGIRIDPANAAPGIYIRRQGASSQKIIIR